MDVIYVGQSIDLNWSIKRNASEVLEDFSRADLKVFLTGNDFDGNYDGKYYFANHIDEQGRVVLDIDPGSLTPGTYCIEAIWIKNSHELLNSGWTRSISRARKDRIFKVSDVESECTDYDSTAGHVVAESHEINIATGTTSYGYDGMSAYETAIFNGSTAKTEKEWIDTYEKAEDRVNYQMDNTHDGETPGEPQSWANKVEVEWANNETTRQSNETTRQSNETTRKNNEGIGATDAECAAGSRRKNESIRQSNEATRQENEGTRQENETTRGNAEDSRQQYEGQGTYSNTTTYPNTRRAKELARQSAENTRVSQENTRLTNEGSVVLPSSAEEHPMPTSGSGRLYNEAVRQHNEDEREAAEATRQSTFEENEGSASTSEAGDGSRWGSYKSAEASRDTAYDTAEGNASASAGDSNRWGAYKTAEASRNAARETTEGTASSTAGDGSRWGAYKSAEASRGSSYDTAEGSSSSEAGDGSRWGAYKTAEAARDSSFESAETTRNAGMAPLVGIFDCSTAAATAQKEVTASNYVLTNGGAFKVKFTYANSASSPTLKINSETAKAIVFNGAVASADNTWGAGEVVEFYYDPTYNSNAGGFIGRSTVVSVSQNIETNKTELLIGNNPALIIDNEPEAESDNLVKSGGVKKLINILDSLLGKEETSVEVSEEINGKYINPQSGTAADYSPYSISSEITLNKGDLLVAHLQCKASACAIGKVVTLNTVWSPSVIGITTEGAINFYYYATDDCTVQCSYITENGISAKIYSSSFINELFSANNENAKEIVTANSSINALLYKSNTNLFDFGELVKGYRVVSNTIENSNKHITNKQLVYVGKGTQIGVKFPSEYNVGFIYFPTNVAGVQRVDYGFSSLTENGTIITLGDYISIDISKKDNSNFDDSELQTIMQYVSIDNYGYSRFFNRNEYNDNVYNAFTSIDLSKIGIYHFAISNSEGEISGHSSALGSELLPIKPQSRLKLTSLDSSKSIKVLFYKINEKGELIWQGNYSWNEGSFIRSINTTIEIVTPANANAIRIGFGGGTTIEDITSTNFELVCHSSSFFRNIPSPLYIGEDVITLDVKNSEWAQGRNNAKGDDTYKQKRCTLCNVFKVTPGQRIIFRHGNENVVYTFNVLGYSDIMQSNTIIDTQLTYLMNGTYIVPYGVNYVSLQAIQGYDTMSTITPEKCVQDLWTIFDATGKTMNMQHSKLEWEWNRATSYAQGMAIQNGFVFQAFADGYIDIWNIATKTLVQSLQVDEQTVYHCNNIWFGDKYDDGDEFGILWINSQDDKPMLGIRVTVSNNVFSFETKYTVLLPPLNQDAENPDYKGDGQYADFKNKILVRFAWKYLNGATIPPNDYGNCMFFVYSWSGDFQDGNLTLIHSFETAIIWPVQGGRLVDGILYLIGGSNSTNEASGAATINVINVIAKKFVGVIDLRKQCFDINIEPQGIDWDGEPCVSTVQGFHRLYL